MKLKRRDLNRLIENLLLEYDPGFGDDMGVDRDGKMTGGSQTINDLIDDDMLAKYNLETLKMIDPSGLLSIPDLPIAFEEYEKDSSLINAVLLILAVIAVIPIAKYFGKIGIKTLKGVLKALEAAKKVVPSNMNSMADDSIKAIKKSIAEKERAAMLDKMDPKVRDEYLEMDSYDKKMSKFDGDVGSKGSTGKSKKFNPNEVPKIEELNKYIKPSPPDSRKLNMTISTASRQLGKNITEDNVISRLRYFRKIDDRDIYVVEDALGNSRAFYKSLGVGTPELSTGGKYFEIDGFGRMNDGSFTWFVKTQEGKLPPKDSVDELLSKVLGDLDQAGQLPPPKGNPIYSEDRAQGVIQSAIFNNGLKEMGVNTDFADATLRNFVYHKGSGVDNQGVISGTYRQR